MRSLEQFDSQQTGDGQVNVIDQFGRKNKRGNRDGVHGNNVSGRCGRGRCFNCNRTGHFAKDTICPARDEKCNECGIHGHFSVCCRKKNSKEPQERNQERDESRKAYQVDEEDNQRTREEYAFVIEEGQSSAGEITLMVGGVQLDGVLIDSGASCNVIGYETWSNLKKKNIIASQQNQRRSCLPTARRNPLKLLGHLWLKLYVRLVVRNPWMSSL